MKKSVNYLPRLLAFAAALVLTQLVFAQPSTKTFNWPEGKKVAISLSFDDARESQVLAGTDLLDAYSEKQTYFVMDYYVEKK